MNAPISGPPADYPLHPQVWYVDQMDGDEREALFAPGSCGRCNQFKEWLRWAHGEPSSLRSFLWELWDQHVADSLEMRP